MAELTPSLAAVDKALKERMGSIPDAGDFDCRPFRINGVLRPDKGWSEHSWANAIDYKIVGHAKQKPYVDMLNTLRSEGVPVGTVLWAGNRPSDHGGHIHTEGAPKYGPAGPPPCAGGKEVETVDTPSAKGGGTRKPDLQKEGDPNAESDINWWDWLINPTGTAMRAGDQFFDDVVRPTIIRIGFGLLLLVLVVVIVSVAVKGFADSQGIDLKAIATRGIVTDGS